MRDYVQNKQREVWSLNTILSTSQGDKNAKNQMSYKGLISFNYAWEKNLNGSLFEIGN